jgi:tetratricopeptide (TPR) repeat protein
MKTLYTLVLSVILSFTSLGQTTYFDNYCSYKTKYDSVESLKKLIRKYKWSRNNLKAAQICFAISNRYRSQHDTISKYWYHRTIDEIKKQYTRERKAEKKTYILYIVGLSYYYLGDYSAARTYFSKTIMCRSPYDCCYYYIGVIDMIYKEYENAIKEFEKFHSLTNENVDELIRSCNGK